MLLTAAASAWALELGPLRMPPAGGNETAAVVVVRGVTEPSQLMAWVASADGYAAAGLNPRHAKPGIVVTPMRTATGEVGLQLAPVSAAGEPWDLLLFATDPTSVQVGRYRIDARAAGRELAPVLHTRSFLARSARAASAPVAGAAASAPAQAHAERVRQAVRAWAEAWSRRDVAGYVASYAPDYAGAPRERTREDWLRERTARLQSRRQIEVTLDGLAIDERGDTAVASFTQTWRADDAAPVRSRKQLTLAPGADGRWRITREAELP